MRSESERLKKLLKLRMKLKRKKPEFLRPWHWRLKRLGTAWRRPKGLDDKIAHKRKGYPPLVEVGYRGPREVRGLHPSGLEEKLVFNIKDLEGLDPSRQAIRIAHTVGRRKKAEIVKRAIKLGLKILNPGEFMEEAKE